MSTSSQNDTPTTRSIKSGIQSRPVVTKVNDLTVIEGYVIPKRDASRIKGHHLTASKALIRDTKFTPTERLILIYLTDMLMDNELCWPSLDRIAEETGLTRSTAIRAIRSLVESEAVIKESGGGRRRSTKYHITQAAYPCQKNPAVLCDRASCQLTCPWSDNIASDRMTATEDINSVNLTRFIPVNSVNMTPKEKNNHHNEKEGGEKRSCPPGAGDPTKHPSVLIEVQDVESGSGHSQVKSLFCQMYEEAFGKPYVWQGHDGAILKGILQLDIGLDKIKAAIGAMFKDQWLVSKGLVNMKVFKSSINTYLPPNRPHGTTQPLKSIPGPNRTMNHIYGHGHGHIGPGSTTTYPIRIGTGI
ncbi:MAG: helix-turn-helix domain-containing protein [Planctomycetes bacterium]|nr:helix-turn-helix domain-containing protein [Planctomycetota bacterium]